MELHDRNYLQTLWGSLEPPLRTQSRTLQNEIEKYTNNDKSQMKLVDYNSGETENKFRFEHNHLLRHDIKLNAGAGINTLLTKTRQQENYIPSES